ncbi:coiled-coil domain-containing protein 83 [Protopterus annectens]|uniref:coiled-coil domain-containing protein 83 n=1 Tax=Protopterus annectens TaxID=7888 RepID=UPI001CF9AA1F|nr:coiled-coil domain-containing protein 83 [Protopterus annectens]
MGKKKKKGGKEGNEAMMTFAEALLAYQIRVKEDLVKQYQNEVNQLEEKNKRYKQRNEHLKEEQLGHVKTLLKQAKEKEKELWQKEVVNKEQVEEALKKKWELAKNEEKMVKALQSDINDMLQKIFQKAQEKQYWLEYKNVGQAEHRKQISLLEKELKEMQMNFDELQEHFSKTLAGLKTKINTETEKKINEKKQLASEKAMNKLDKQSCQEIQENEWLAREVKIYKKHITEAEERVQNLEQENLELMSYLFDCRLEDLKISRNIFLTQVAGIDVPEINVLGVPATNLLEENIKKLPLDTPTDLDTTIQSDVSVPRPKSAMLESVEHKVFSVLTENEDDDDGIDNDEEKGCPLQSVSQELSCLLYGDQEHFQEYFQLGPLELKLLRVVGKGMTVNEANSLQEASTQDSDMATARSKDDWPITPELIHSALTGNFITSQANTNTVEEFK